MNAVI